jgi:hypothetical protein
MNGNDTNTQTDETSTKESASRRLVLKSSLATLAAVGTGTFASLAKAAPFANSSSNIDDDVLNFALNLEYLEAEFYNIAVHGTGIPQSDTTGTGNRGGVRGGSKVPFASTALRNYAKEIADDELNHVLFLRSALGDKAVARPEINLGNSFNVLAQAAGLGASFDPFASETNFLIGAFVFEDVGVTAYHGAAGLITSKAYLSAAAGILAVEAYHAGIIRTLCYQNSLTQQTHKISDLRNKLSNEAGSGGRSDEGIVFEGNVNLVAADPTTSIAFSRDTAEVLNIVYAGGKANDFGFFPSRMNGDIR